MIDFPMKSESMTKLEKLPAGSSRPVFMNDASSI